MVERRVFNDPLTPHMATVIGKQAHKQAAKIPVIGPTVSKVIKNIPDKAIGMGIGAAFGEVTTTTHFKDGSSTVEGSGWSVDYDRNGKKKRVNTGMYTFD